LTLAVFQVVQPLFVGLSYVSQAVDEGQGLSEPSGGLSFEFAMQTRQQLDRLRDGIHAFGQAIQSLVGSHLLRFYLMPNQLN